MEGVQTAVFKHRLLKNLLAGFNVSAVLFTRATQSYFRKRRYR